VLERVRVLNKREFRQGAKYVLYWAQMNRRVESNQALIHAADLANSLDLPLLYYEALTCTYAFANDRIHMFILEGVPATSRKLRRLGIGYAFYLRRKKSDPDNLLYDLAKDAAAIVTDDYPTFIARQHNAAVPPKLDIPYYVVDASCIVPMNRFVKQEYAAYTIRPKIQRLLKEHMKPAELPKLRRPFASAVPRWHLEFTAGDVTTLVQDCEIDHAVSPSTAYSGGSANARKRLDRFLDRRLVRYAREKNNPSSHATSNLSPYLHFGHISALEIAIAVKKHAEEHKLVADEFLEELIVRRELAFNFARFAESYDSLAALPDWARATLRCHAHDRRDPVFSREQLERAETYDPLWNATQRELLLRGKIHGYYRMYWGKKIIEWSPSHEDALHAMIYFHDRYALDGRDPNTYANVLWCFGLHDRPFYDRPVFGQVRYMSYDGMKRKTGVDAYIQEIAHIEQTGEDPERL
jgi:deoxyribodipyrimidine photo-lyase